MAGPGINQISKGRQNQPGSCGQIQPGGIPEQPKPCGLATLGDKTGEGDRAQRLTLLLGLVFLKTLWRKQKQIFRNVLDKAGWGDDGLPYKCGASP